MRVLIFLTLTAAAFAADLNGTWRFEAVTKGGAATFRTQITYVFKVDGASFNGVYATLTDRRDIVNGKIDGNQITFDTKFEFDDPPRLTPFRGEIDGDTLKVSPVRATKNPPPVTTLTRISAATVYHMPPELEHKPFPTFKPIPPNG